MSFEEWYKQNESKLYDYRLAVEYDYGEKVAKEIYDSLQPRWKPIETAPKYEPILTLMKHGVIEGEWDGDVVRGYYW